MKHAKKAFLASVLSVVLCVTMLVGTTYAWFTDSVTSAGNKIIAGNLDIDLYQHDGTSYVEITDNSAPIFGSSTSTIAQNNNADTLWEPGKTQVAYLKLQNNGSLYLKYTVKLVVKNVANDLYEVMKYKIVPDAHFGDVTAWDSTGAVSIANENIADGASTTIATSAVNVPMASGAEHYFALAIHMDEEAGNAYQNGEVDFDIQVLATQYTAEADSFGTDYDATADETPDNAGWPFVNFTSASADVETTQSTTIGNVAVDGVQATISADAVDGATSLTLVVKETTAQNNVIAVTTGSDSQYFDVSLYDQDNNVVESFEENGYADVQLDLGTGLIITEVNHKTTALTTTANADGEYYAYDASTGILTLHVTSFSPFSVGYNEAVAKIGDTYYGTFVEALNAGLEDSGSTIMVLQDCNYALPSRTDIENTALTIDLNGHVVTNTSNHYSKILRPYDGAVVSIIDNSGTGRGELAAAVSSMNVFQVLGTARVTIKDVKLSSQSTCVSISGAENATFENVTFSTSSNYSAALSISGGDDISLKNCALTGGPAIQCSHSFAGHVLIDGCNLVGFYTSILTVQNSSADENAVQVLNSTLSVRSGAMLQAGVYLQQNAKSVRISNTTLDMANSTHTEQYAIRITSVGVTTLAADGLQIKNVTGYAICMDMDGYGTATFQNSTFQTTEETVEMDHAGGSVTFNNGCVINTNSDDIYYTAKGSMTTINPGVTLNVNPGTSDYKYTVNGTVVDNGDGTWSIN